MKPEIKLLLLSLLVLVYGACAPVPEKKGPPPAAEWIPSSSGGQSTPGPNSGKSGTGNSQIADALLPRLTSRMPDSRTSSTDRRFNVSARDMGAHEFFMSLVAGTGLNLVVHPDISGVITLNLKGVTMREALTAVRDTYGYDFEQTEYGYRILPNALTTRVFHIDYLDIKRNGKSLAEVNSGESLAKQIDSRGTGLAAATKEKRAAVSIETSSKTDFWGNLESGLNQIVSGETGGTVTISPQTGVVVVTASQHEIRRVGQYIEAMRGNLERQVVLEAKIIEVTLSDGFQSGINWAGLAQAGSGGVSLVQTGGGTLVNGGRAPTAGSGGNLGPQGANLPPLDLTSAFGGAFSIALNWSDFTGFIELLSTQGDVQVLSSPRVSTINNQKAVIKAGSDEFFITDISATTTNSGNVVTTTPSVSLTPFFSGIALDVTPQISNDGIVTLHVHPSVSEVVEKTKSIPLGNQQQNVSLALSTVRESDSVVRARSGQVVVIGGLMQTTIEDVDAGLPMLGDVPVVGNLFKHQRRSTIKKELVILLRPIVVDHNTWDDQLSDTRSRMSM